MYQYIHAVYSDLSQCSDEFVKGVELLEQCSVEDAILFFEKACNKSSSDDPLLHKYRSFFGLTRLLNGERDAIKLCQSAMEQFPFDGDVCLNLARAEYFHTNRLEALTAIETGLKFSSGHPGLQKLKEKMGVRVRKPVPFVSRDNWVNNWLGRKLRKTRF